MWNHPPAGVILIALGIRLFGDNSFGWRISSAVFGAIGIMIAYLLALDLSRRRSVAFLTALFLLCDSLYFVQSRTGMLDIFGVVFMTSAVWSFYRFLCAPASRAARPLIWTGLFAGLGVATKWNAAYASILLGVAVFARVLAVGWAARRRPDDRELQAGWRSLLVAAPVGFILVPVLIYFAAYIPFFATGHTFAQWFELQKQILYYHTHLRETHAYQSRWWQWPLTLRPVWYYAMFVNGRWAHIYANGNLFLYALFVPGVLWTGWRWWKLDRRAVSALAIGFFGQWLPWMLVTRIAFIYHFLPAAIFGSLGLAWATGELLERKGWRRAVAVGYIALVVANFAYFYPIRAAVPITPKAVDQRMWFKQWR
jgi:dolichyl-phosphate-mannose--protein O-mannosyl transferase